MKKIYRFTVYRFTVFTGFFDRFYRFTVPTVKIFWPFYRFTVYRFAKNKPAATLEYTGKKHTGFSIGIFFKKSVLFPKSSEKSESTNEKSVIEWYDNNISNKLSYYF